MHSAQAIRKGTFKEIKMTFTVTRTVVKTSTGYVVNGAFSCMMRLDENGKVVYSNMNPHAKEYKAMYRTFKKSI